jgi:putative FmdB family regulatory protein
MPRYDFKCEDCQEILEIFIPLDEYVAYKDNVTCQSCGGKCKQIYKPIGVFFKGSGFYVNDYGKSNKS